MTFLASSAAALYSQITLWTGRANNAWGASRVWSSGSSFETDLANMTTDRNNWQTNANNAWGASRVYNSGESWEAAYNRVLPPSAVQEFQAPLTGSYSGGGARQISFAAASVNSLGATHGGNYIALPKAGYYVITVYLTGDNTSGNTSDHTTTTLSHSVQGQLNTITAPLGRDAGGVSGGAHFTGLLSAGNVTLAVGTSFDNFNFSTNPAGQITIVFVPTQSNPH